MASRVPDCHPERAHQARGMCDQCYQHWYERNRRKESRSESPRMATCHVDRRHHAKGLCESCYVAQWQNSVKATCHPTRPHIADGLCARCYSKRRYELDPEIVRAQVRKDGARYRERNRQELIQAYGGKCACPNCPEANIAFLCLDHVNGDGKVHRMKVGSHTYADLRRRGFPQEGFRLLCWNCNSATRFGRVCPHMEGA